MSMEADGWSKGGNKGWWSGMTLGGDWEASGIFGIISGIPLGTGGDNSIYLGDKANCR